eukprot:TRINITY_DN1498_c1_g1_i1.p1 TRINITY_DN1498_c1_g1~~TRINITY_DN1498_c1_g1_i1.p1  ORF type:complete len:444 (+),score=86.91 TRINITY_DN1498_c1_g1_i1:243-1574(+)
MVIMVASLTELCMRYLINNLEMVETFDGIEPVLREKLRYMLMNGKKRQPTLEGMIKLVDSESKVLDLTGLRPGQQMQISHLVNLEEFKMTGSTELGDPSISRIVAGFPKLRVIDLSRCPRITDQTFYSLSKSCPLLEVIRLSDCVSITGNFFTGVKRSLEGNNTNTNNNNNNNNTNNNNNNNGGESSSSGFWGLFKKAQPTLSTAGSGNLTANIVNMEIDSVPLVNLRELDISGCKSLHKENMSNLCKAFPNLVSLNISKCFFGDETAPLFLESFTPNITKLSLALSPVATSSLVALGRLVWLKDLSLHTCRGIPDSALVDLIAKLVNLEYLDISDCFQLTEYIFFPLTQLPDPLVVLPKLKELNISSCSKMSHFTLEHISSFGCKNTLKVIKMARLPVDLEHVMHKIIPKMIVLEKLDVRENKIPIPLAAWSKEVPRVTLQN